MLTFTDQVNLCKEISGLSDASTVITFKRDLNAGTARFLSKLNRPIDYQNRFTNMVVAQQFYQLPEDAIRLSKVKSNATGEWISLKLISDEDTWININSTNQTGNPTHYYPKGNDEFGLYPTPSQAITDGIEIIYEPKHVLLTADDYTTGTISATNGSQAITGNSTVFTPQLANGTYVLQVTDGNDGNYYKITGYSNATSITIENYYQGITSSTATYRIGQVSKIPEEYQDSPVDYAMFRHFASKSEKNAADYHEAHWISSLKDAEDTYGMNTGNQVIYASNQMRAYNPLLDVTQDMIQT